jgi:hypothetical protein
MALQPLTDQGWQTINELAQRYGLSTDAVMTMLQAVVNGNGSMAQFNHGELGGGGQWMLGGMTMVGDMFNHGLKAKVDNLCTELSRLLAQQPFVPPAPVGSSQSQWQGGQTTQTGGYGGGAGQAGLFVPGSQGGSGSWWPGELGSPNASGGQNNVRYAYFAGPRRLAVDVNGQVSVYDTLDHQIGGVSQQQGPGSSLTFNSQYGTVNVASLPVVSGAGSGDAAPQQNVPEPAPWQAEPPPAATAQEADIFAKIERLAELQQKGILTPEEYSAKKAELLGRL